MPTFCIPLRTRKSQELVNNSVKLHYIVLIFMYFSYGMSLEIKTTTSILLLN